MFSVLKANYEKSNIATFYNSMRFCVILKFNYKYIISPLLMRAHLIYTCCSVSLHVSVCLSLHSLLRQISMYPQTDRQTEVEKIPSHRSPPSWLHSFFHRVSLQWLPQKQLLSTFAWRGGGGGLTEEAVYLSDVCGSSLCLFSLTTDFQTAFQMAASQTDNKAKTSRQWTRWVSSLLFRG